MFDGVNKLLLFFGCLFFFAHFYFLLADDTEKDIKTTVLQDALRKAASLAVQMEIGEKAAADLLAEEFDRIKSQKVRETE